MQSGVIKAVANLGQDIGNLLRQKGLTLGAVESATGGLISHLITDVSGSSDYYKGSVTAYSNETKIKVVYIPITFQLDTGKLGKQVASAAGILRKKNLTSAGLVATIQYVHYLEFMQNELKKEGIEGIIGKGDKRLASLGQLLGCNF